MRGRAALIAIAKSQWRESPSRIVCARVTYHGRTFKGESRARHIVKEIFQQPRALLVHICVPLTVKQEARRNVSNNSC